MREPRLRKRRRLAFAAVVLGVLVAAFVAYGYWEAGQLRVVERELFFEGLPPAFDGLRVIHLADLHTRSFGRVERRLRRLLESTPADLLVVTGDFKAHARTPDEKVHASLDRIFEGIDYPWGLLAAPGNHDTTAFFEGLAERGRFTCPFRRSVMLEWKGQRLVLLMVTTMRPNDHNRGKNEIWKTTWEGRVARRCAPWRLLPDGRAIPFVCDRITEGEAFRILLCHTPDFIVDARKEGIGLVLAGDTHGGQVRLPFNAALLAKSRLSRRYARGHFVEGKTQMHVSPGVGTLYIPIRFLCRPEVSVLVLHRQPAEKQ